MAGTAQIVNPANAHPPGNPPVGGAGVPVVLEAEYVATATITAPAVVSSDTTGNKATTCATATTASLAVGVCTVTAATTGSNAKVVTYGVVRNVPCDGSVAVGDVLKRSVTTTGSVATTASPATGEKLGVALAASASNTVTMFVCK